jgi:hypothetical protein
MPIKIHFLVEEVITHKKASYEGRRARLEFK